MKIIFEFDHNLVRDEEFGTMSWRVTLFAKTSFGYMRTWVGDHPSKPEAERIAFENFLNNNWYLHTEGLALLMAMENVTFNDRASVEVSHLPQEYQDLIWQLIDAKKGSLLNKLTGSNG